MSFWNQISFQDGANMRMMGLTFYHDLVLLIMVMVMYVVSSFMVGFVLKNVFMNGATYRFGVSNEHLEIFWTLLPSLVLLVVAFPSLGELYGLEVSASVQPEAVMKVTGHQWYWSYEYFFSESISMASSGEMSFSFLSYMLPIEDILNDSGMFRLLDVDNRFVLPCNEDVNVVTSSADVIHCWAIPSAAVKVDTVPGRLNMISLNLGPGVVYGQCSEICGANHSSMPIVGEFVPLMGFDFWVNSWVKGGDGSFVFYPSTKGGEVVSNMNIWGKTIFFFMDLFQAFMSEFVFFMVLGYGRIMLVLDMWESYVDSGNFPENPDD